MVTAFRWLLVSLFITSRSFRRARAPRTRGRSHSRVAAGMARGAARGEPNQAARANASNPTSKG
jgi:hypothetical protein